MKPLIKLQKTEWPAPSPVWEVKIMISSTPPSYQGIKLELNNVI